MPELLFEKMTGEDREFGITSKSSGKNLKLLIGLRRQKISPKNRLL